MSSFGYRKAEDLPVTIPVFPLGGAVLFPRWTLPLNIFEPRYLNMVDDALANDRLIGIVQTMQGGTREVPALADVGCVGRIASFSETDDGRYLVSLNGICRFSIHNEIEDAGPYRVVEADWFPFESDLQEPTTFDLPNLEKIVTALEAYLKRNQYSADWSAVSDAPVEILVNALCAGCPFSNAEKQALIETVNLRARSETLIALLDMDQSGEGSTWLQ